MKLQKDSSMIAFNDISHYQDACDFKKLNTGVSSHSMAAEATA